MPTTGFLLPTARTVDAGSGTWTNDVNILADDGAEATFSLTSKNTAGRWLRGQTFNFDAAIPVGATIDLVEIRMEYRVNNTGGVANPQIQAFVGGTGIGTVRTASPLEPITLTLNTFDITADRAWTRADFLNGTFELYVRGQNGNSTTDPSYRWDYIAAQVTYSTAQNYTQTINDNLGLTDTGVSRNIAATGTEPSNLTDTATSELLTIHERTVNDNLGLTDTTTRVYDGIRSITDNLGLTETLAPILDAIRSVTDNLGLTDTTTTELLILHDRTVNDNLGLTDTTIRVYDGIRTITDSLGLTDETTVQAAGDNTRNVDDNLGLTDTVQRIVDYIRDNTDNLGTTDTVQVVVEKSLNEALGLTDTLSVLFEASRTIADDLGITDTLSVQAAGSTIAQADSNLGLTDSVLVTLTRTVIDNLGLTDITIVSLLRIENPDFVALIDHRLESEADTSTIGGSKSYRSTSVTGETVRGGTVKSNVTVRLRQ